MALRLCGGENRSRKLPSHSIGQTTETKTNHIFHNLLLVSQFHFNFPDAANVDNAGDIELSE